MPGFDRTLDSRIALINQEGLAKALQIAPDILATLQALLVAQQQQNAFKKPSLFFSGNQSVFGSNNYDLTQVSDPSTLLLTQSGVTTVGYFSLQDADSVIIKLYLDAAGNSGPFFVMGALSPNPNFSQIPADQFFLLGIIGSSSILIPSTSGGNITSGGGQLETTGNIDPVSGIVDELTDLSALELNFGINNSGDVSGTILLTEEVPCAGNRYMHICGALGGNDLINQLVAGLTGVGTIFTYALKK